MEFAKILDLIKIYGTELVDDKWPAEIYTLNQTVFKLAVAELEFEAPRIEQGNELTLHYLLHEAQINYYAFYRWLELS